MFSFCNHISYAEPVGYWKRPLKCTSLHPGDKDFEACFKGWVVLPSVLRELCKGGCDAALLLPGGPGTQLNPPPYHVPEQTGPRSERDVRASELGAVGCAAGMNQGKKSLRSFSFRNIF